MPCGRPLSRSWNRPPSLRHHKRDIVGAYGWKRAQRPDLSIVLRPYLFPDLTIVVDHGRKELAFGRVAAQIDSRDEDAVLRHVQPLRGTGLCCTARWEAPLQDALVAQTVEDAAGVNGHVISEASSLSRDFGTNGWDSCPRRFRAERAGRSRHDPHTIETEVAGPLNTGCARPGPGLSI